jgi:type IV pilus assembly protein PilB
MTIGGGGGNRLGELLVRERLISMQQLRVAQEEQRRTGQNLGFTLAKLGYVSDGEITDFLSQQYRVPSVDLAAVEFDPDVVKLVPKEVCERYRVVPISRAGSSLIVAMADPTNLHATDDLRALTRFTIEPVVASEAAIVEALGKLFAEKPFDVNSLFGDLNADDVNVVDAEEDQSNSVDLAQASEEAPVVRLCNGILLKAVERRASDIHIECYEKSMRVRYRVDGVLQEEMQIPLKMKNAVISRIKIMSALDIAERRLPQDGRIKLKLPQGKEMDFRVSVLPTLWGEKTVLRLLDKSNLQLDMTKLGFERDQLDHFMKAIHLPFGMVLVTGPTGSGKTTTLYSALSELNKTSENISTAEDPVEFNLQGINQVQMKDDVGLNFAAALRSFLRQDPDIIMVGEIRDFETAEIAVKAALTGHMVLSTLHTNDAPATVSRLLNMGVEPFLVTASVNLILAQRLARKICVECKEETSVPFEALRELGFSTEQARSTKIYKGRGCKVCGEKGYKGRIALYEVMPFRETLKELVLQGVSSAELKGGMIREGIRTLRMSGIRKIIEGTTTVEEVTRTTAPDDPRVLAAAGIV